MGSIIRRACWFAGVLVVTALIFGKRLLAAGVDAPEIDASALSAGLGLLTGAILLLRSRKRSGG